MQSWGEESKSDIEGRVGPAAQLCAALSALLACATAFHTTLTRARSLRTRNEPSSLSSSLFLDLTRLFFPLPSPPLRSPPFPSPPLRSPPSLPPSTHPANAGASAGPTDGAPKRNEDLNDIHINQARNGVQLAKEPTAQDYKEGWCDDESRPELQRDPARDQGAFQRALQGRPEETHDDKEEANSEEKEGDAH